jgi:hypothetical protein
MTKYDIALKFKLNLIKNYKSSAMAKQKKSKIQKICDRVDQLIKKKANSFEFFPLVFEFRNLKPMDIATDDIALMCSKTLELASTKGTAIRTFEKDWWTYFSYFPILVGMKNLNDAQADYDEVFSELEGISDEILLENMTYENNPIKTELSKLLGLISDVLAIKKDSTVAWHERRGNALIMLKTMMEIISVPSALEIAGDSLNSKNAYELCAALDVLHTYCEFEEELDEDYEEILDEILNNTKEFSVMKAVIDVNVSSGWMEEIEAQNFIKTWAKDNLGIELNDNDLFDENEYYDEDDIDFFNDDLFDDDENEDAGNDENDNIRPING